MDISYFSFFKFRTRVAFPMTYIERWFESRFKGRTRVYYHGVHGTLMPQAEVRGVTKTSTDKQENSDLWLRNSHTT